MLQRCLNPASKCFKDYGGRGISVCDEWLNFAVFFEDMGSVPEGKTLERKNNELGYFPANCVWADRKQQSRNRRSNWRVLFEGEVLCLSEVAEKMGVNYMTLKSRVRRGTSGLEIVT
jgi:hypothetical protein